VSKLINKIIASPPQVHVNSPLGVWRTDRRCYEFIERNVSSGDRTMETGLGISTALFAAWGTEHTCIIGDEREVSVLREYVTVQGWSTDRLNFVMGNSADVLPGFVPPAPLDLYLIDACHAFPFAALDWYYGARWLRVGGMVVFDDMQIPAVANTVGWFLDADPRWETVERNGRWAAYRRLSESGFVEEFTEQLFLGDPRFLGEPS